MPINSFRGLLESEGQTKIRLSTTDGMIGYRIVKFQTIPKSPGTTGIEAITKIYKVEQGTPDVTVNFDDPTLLGVSYYQDDANVAYPSSQDIIFDNDIFNQDIYITMKQGTGSHQMNWYLELESIRLNPNSQAVITLKDIRTNTV